MKTFSTWVTTILESNLFETSAGAPTEQTFDAPGNHTGGMAEEEPVDTSATDTSAAPEATPDVAPEAEPAAKETDHPYIAAMTKLSDVIDEMNNSWEDVQNSVEEIGEAADKKAALTAVNTMRKYTDALSEAYTNLSEAFDKLKGIITKEATA